MRGIPDTRYITKVNPKKGTPYYFVRAPISARGNKTKQNCFYITSSISNEQALSKAKKSRDETIQKYFGVGATADTIKRTHYGSKTTKRSFYTTDVIGVCRTVAKKKPGSPASWIASWSEGEVKNRKVKTKTFTVSKHGEQEAYNKAVAKREEMVILHAIEHRK